MRKNTKAILVLLCALVMVLTGIGIPKARAAEGVDSLTVDSIFDSLGAALEYGTVAREWTQGAHAETNACVDVMNRLTNTIFSNTGSTYFHALGYELQADVSAPENPKGMVFALFKQNKDGTDYTMCPGTEKTMAAGVTATTLTWNIGDKDDASVSELKNTRLFVMQVENGTYVKDGTKNEAELIVTYGPSVSASAYNTNYIGKMFYPATKNAETGEYIPPLGEGDSVAVFNTTSYSPGIEFGPETRLYYRQDKYNEETGKTEAEYIEIDPNDTTLDIGTVLVNYYYGDENDPSEAYAKLDDLSFKNGVFIKGEDVINISYKQEEGYAKTLVSNAGEYAQELANMGGGEITSLTPNANGGSTVVGPKDENGNVVSLYEAEVGADGVFSVKADMGWAGIPVAENEYVIINVICSTENGKPLDKVYMGKDASDITYFHSEGQTSGEGVQWGGEDSNSSQRVIFNFVYADENGILRPYEGTVEPTSRHGGTLLVPNGKVELIGEVHNGAIIADEVYNGQEIHQRCFAAQARSTWVRMDCGTIWLQKASVGYNWGTGEWEDQSNKTGISLKGAVFGVYTNENCTEDSLVMTMTTDETGKATSDLLSAGTYWVKEITPLKDHNLSDKVVEVKVVAGVPTQVMGGGYFVENGGHYEYPMFRPPVWVPHYDEIVAEEKFVNQQNNGFTTLRLVKNDEFGNVLSGAEFGVYDEDGKLVVSAKSNRNGVVLFENVPLRQTSATNTSVTYTIKEITPPEGYHKNNSSIKITLNKKDHRDKIVTIDGNGNAAGEAFVNETIRGNIALKKVNAADSKITLEGAEFTVYSDKECTKVVGVMKTGKNGIATSKTIDGGKGLLPGTYYVVETKEPEGYKQRLDNSVYPPVPVVYTVDVKFGKTVDVVTNMPIANENNATGIGNDQYIHVSGVKRWFDDEFSDQRPQEVTIELNRKKADGSNEWIAEKKIVGPDWKFDFDHVELPRYDANGKEIEYVIREKLPSYQYYYAFVKQAKDNNGNITVTVSNSVKTTRIEGSKKWEDKLDSEHPDKLTFLLFVDVNGELTQVHSPYDSSQMYTVEAQKDQDYKFVFENLPTYDVNGNPAEYVVKEADSDDYHVVKIESSKAVNGDQTTITMTLTNRLTVPLKGTKIWDDGSNASGTRPDNVELQIFRNNERNPLKFGNGRWEISGVEIIWDKETDTDVWTWKVVGLPKYSFDWMGNPTLNTYRVEEKAVPGYKSEVTTDDNGIHFTNTLDGKGRIRLYKENEDGVRLDGVEFGLYTDPNCTPESRLGVYKTEYKAGSNEHGKLEIPNIPYGTYYLKEETTPDGYVENTKIYKVEVYKPGTEPSDIENGDREHPQIPGNMNVVVNKKAGETTSVTVSKFWYHEGNPNAASIDENVTEALTLYIKKADDTEVVVNAADGTPLRPTKQDVYDADGKKTHAEYTWRGLLLLPDGEEYIVREDTSKLPYGYTVHYSNGKLDYATDGNGVYNRYFSASANFIARKYVDGKAATEVFKFQLVDKATGEVLQTAKNNTALVMNNGTVLDALTGVSFTLKYDGSEHMGKEYEYVIREVGGVEGYICDTTEYQVKVAVNADGTTTPYLWDEKTQQYVVLDRDDLVNGKIAFNNKTVTSVTITKFWVNEDFASADEVPNIADKLILCKLVNGEPVPVNNAPKPTYETPDKHRSYYTWSDLPKYDENGNEIEYVVVEQAMPGYKQTYSGDGTYAPNGGSIDNEWQTTAVFVAKVWNGGSLADSDISDNLVLRADGVDQTAKPTKEGNVYAWYDLPMYNAEGKLIVYTVYEKDVPAGYVVSYEPMYIGEDADQEVAKDFAFTYETITNTYEAEGEFAFKASKALEGRKLEAGEFTFVLEDRTGAILQTVKNDADGNVVFEPLKFTEADVDYAMDTLVTYCIYEVEGDLPGVTYDETGYEITLKLTDDNVGNIIVEPVGENLPQILFTNTYEEKTYESKGEVEFDGVKVLNGRAMKAGEFTFILTDKNGKELQRVTNAADGTFAFAPIKYTEKDVPYGKDAEFTYYITELAGNLPGVTYDAKKYEIVVGLWDDMAGTIHVGDISECANEIVFTNTYEAEGSVTFKGAKFLLGREFKQGDEFTFELLNEKGDVIDTVTINPTSGAKADFAFKTIKYELDDAGKTYTYTYRVKEKADNEEGMTYDDTVHTVTVTVSDAGNGSLKVVASNNANALNFTNTYLAEGSVLFSGTKTMNGKTLVGKDFTFVLTDADGKEIETVTNDKDGKIVFSAIQYKLEDAGKTFTYKVYEKNDGKKSVTYDDTVYTVTVKVEDTGNGHLKATASGNATKLNFTNSYEAKAVLTMNAYKTVNGYKPSVDQVYDFVLLGDDGTEMKAQNKDEVITFGTIGFDEEDVGKTFIYTIKETTEVNELLDVDTAIYQVAVTVTDGGDGNLKLETEILKDGKRANGVVFANTATATLSISKTVKGPGPDKAFDLKVTFIGVDGKELEGVYDYDGDVKGTITSGGVIALKDGQSVTIVGLPEGATYTVEENAGPAYTVTVNGKPIAKAEGTLVGHGKLEFINTVETTTFSVTKVWEGTDLGAITLTLYADGKQITPQPEVTREGDKYTYYNLPKYNEEGEEIVYSAKERGIDGYIRIYNNVEPFQKVTGFVHDGGTIINREIEEEVHELSFKIRKVWTGVEATEEIPAITLTLFCNGEKLDVPTPKPDSAGWYKYYDLPKTVNGQIAVYTVVEEPIPGFTVTYKTASGEIVEEGVNGGEIVNAKIPQTGDPATLGLWLAMMGASAVLLTMLQRRRKA